jgi:magnesium-transporting ATPase (P-type)
VLINIKLIAFEIVYYKLNNHRPGYLVPMVIYWYYPKNAEFIEKLSQIDYYKFDKTGTLTQSGKHIKYDGTDLSEDD